MTGVKFACCIGVPLFSNNGFPEAAWIWKNAGGLYLFLTISSRSTFFLLTTEFRVCYMVSQKISNLQLHHLLFASDLPSLSASLNDSLLPVPVKVVKAIMIAERENPSAVPGRSNCFANIHCYPADQCGVFYFPSRVIATSKKTGGQHKTRGIMKTSLQTLTKQHL